MSPHTRRTTRAGPAAYVQLKYMKEASGGLCASLYSSSPDRGCEGALALCSGNCDSDLTLQECDTDDDFQIFYLEELDAATLSFLFHIKAYFWKCLSVGCCDPAGDTANCVASCLPLTLAPCDPDDPRQKFNQPV